MLTAANVELTPEQSISSGQFNIFTGELESSPLAPATTPEERWLFDPDFGLALPEEVAGQQVLVDEGLTLSFPVSYRPTRKPPVRSDGMSVGAFEHRDTSNGDRQLYVAQAEDAAQLIVSGFGTYLGKKSERLQVKLGGKALYEFPSVSAK
jgi:hypothetical protein